jgi:hypothetical protein
VRGLPASAPPLARGQCFDSPNPPPPLLFSSYSSAFSHTINSIYPLITSPRLRHKVNIVQQFSSQHSAQSKRQSACKILLLPTASLVSLCVCVCVCVCVYRASQPLPQPFPFNGLQSNSPADAYKSSRRRSRACAAFSRRGEATTGGPRKQQAASRGRTNRRKEVPFPLPLSWTAACVTWRGCRLVVLVYFLVVSNMALSLALKMAQVLSRPAH